MRVALVAPPFLPVPPRRYGGTELFIAQLAEGLQAKGVDVVVYTISESTVGVETRWFYKDAQWPIKGEVFDNLKDMNHSSWAIRDASKDCDIIHLHNVPSLMFTRYVQNQFVYTVHHVHEDPMSEIYANFPDVEFVTISEFQRSQEAMERIRTIHHGVDMKLYQFKETKQDYLAFLGRIAPIKGTHLAIELARRTGMPLKIAGEIQPIFQDYFDTMVKPHIDGKFIEFVGEADPAAKNELLGNARAMVFPIQWNEPFGLVMIEAMACGTPVLALPGGSVEEVVRDGVSGFVSNSIEEMADQAVPSLSKIKAQTVRAYASQHFSVDRMVDDYIGLYQELVGDASPLGTTRSGPPVRGISARRS